MHFQPVNEIEFFFPLLYNQTFERYCVWNDTKLREHVFLIVVVIFVEVCVSCMCITVLVLQMMVYVVDCDTLFIQLC